MANTKVKAEQLEAAQTNITSLGTLTSLTVDDITINGSTISDGADLTLDVAGDIILDADGGNIYFKDGGTEFLEFEQDSGGCTIRVDASNTDLKFVGNDGGSAITALTLDMSDAGGAIFNAGGSFGGQVTATRFDAATASTTDPVLQLTDTGVIDYDFTFPDTGTIQIGVSASSNKELKLVNAGSGMFGLNVAGHTLPAVNNTYSLGSSSLRYYQVWAGTNMISPTYIATGNVVTGGYQLTNTGGDGKPALTSDANNWTIIRPIISGADVAVNNFANTANLFTITDEGNVGLNENTPTSYYSKTFQINGSGNTSAIKLTNTSTGNENGRGMDIASDTTNLRIVNREVGGIELYTGPVGSPALGFSLDTNGHVRMPKQSCAMVQLSTNQQNMAATVVTIQFNTPRFDQNSDFNTSNYKFVAPTTGKYLVTVNLYMNNIDNAAAYYQLYIASSNRTFYTIFDPSGLGDGDPSYWDMSWANVIDMDESDDVYFQLVQSGGAAQQNLDQHSTASFALIA